jgi:hypothetical protein
MAVRNLGAFRSIDVATVALSACQRLRDWHRLIVAHDDRLAGNHMSNGADALD